MRTNDAVTGAGVIPVSATPRCGPSTLPSAPAPRGSSAASRARRSRSPLSPAADDRMALATLPLVFVLAGLTIYVVLPGADFGAAIWQITTARTPEGRRIRDSRTTLWRRCGRPTTCG